MSYLYYFHPKWSSEPVYSKFGKVLQKIFEIFGKDRVIFASNYPLDRWSKDLVERETADKFIGNYINILKQFVFTEEKTFFQDLDNFFSKNGMRAYRMN